jgi:tetratricopeptide (TPR) repeat protein
MRCISVFIVFIFMSAGSSYSAECPTGRYAELVQQGKAAETEREWEKVVDLYSNILSDCRTTIPAADLPKAYDSLSTAQLMLNKYQDALENCEKCIALDHRYNACMMTAARVHEALGNTQQAIESARDAAAVEPYDDYSAAVSIFASDFLRRYKQK